VSEENLTAGLEGLHSRLLDKNKQYTLHNTGKMNYSAQINKHNK